MFLSLVRPDRISSPITSSAAVTTSFGADEFAIAMTTLLVAFPRRRARPYPAIVGYDASSHPLVVPGPDKEHLWRETRCPDRRRCARLPMARPGSSAKKPPTAT